MKLAPVDLQYVHLIIVIRCRNTTEVFGEFDAIAI